MLGCSQASNFTLCSGLASECIPGLTSAQLTLSNYWQDVTWYFGPGAECAGQWPDPATGQQWRAPQQARQASGEPVLFFDVSRTFTSSIEVGLDDVEATPFTGGLLGNTSLATADPSYSGYGGHLVTGSLTLNDHLELDTNTWLTVNGDLDMGGFNITLNYQARLNVTGRITRVGSLQLRVRSLLYASTVQVEGTGDGSRGRIRLGYLARAFLSGGLISVPVNSTLFSSLADTDAYPLTPGYYVSLTLDPYAELRAASISISGQVTLRSHSLVVVESATGSWGGFNVVRSVTMDAHVEIESGPMDIGGTLLIGSQCAVVIHGNGRTGLHVRFERPTLDSTPMAQQSVPFTWSGETDNWALHVSAMVRSRLLVAPLGSPASSNFESLLRSQPR